MTRTADPLERLHAANPVAAVPAVNWERIQQHVTRGASDPRDRRPRLLVIAGTGCAGMLVLAAITMVLLSRATTPGRAPSSRSCATVGTSAARARRGSACCLTAGCSHRCRTRTRA